MNNIHSSQNINKLRNQLVDIIDTKGIRNLNVGCGWDYFPRKWLNIGVFPKKRIIYGEVKMISNAYVLHFDLTNPLPIDNNQIKYIYGSHFIEHLNFLEAIVFLQRCYKIMQKEGVIRITTPDLELWIKKYYNNNNNFFNKFYRLLQSFPLLKTKGEILIGQIHGWGHKWLYDFESIKDILKRVGFRQINRKNHHESVIPDIKEIEPSSNFRLMETMYVEAKK